MDNPDILIFMSDQHNALCGGFAGSSVVETPNLDKIAAQGTVFEAAYTSCPLCVPARMSMLTGQLPSETGIFTNWGAIPEDQSTFLHSLVAKGYETVLCGRMHFRGIDQRHGFTKRIMKDITMGLWGKKDNKKNEKGIFSGTLGMNGCLNLIGGGTTSPVVEYDKAVIEKAVEYLKKEHNKPQCIVVGTYSPHFPYVAPVNLYKYYKKKVALPSASENKTNYEQPLVQKKEQRFRTSAISGKKEKVDDEIKIRAKAAYYGMITNLDRQIGKIKKCWEQYLERNEKKGIFVYLSDHGDTIGEHNIFGKQTFYEGSARIPLIFNGEGIKKGKRIKGPVSIMDLGPTFCDIIDAKTLPEQDGESLVPNIFAGIDNRERSVLSEFVELKSEIVPGRMIRKNNWKLISYANNEEYDLLFDLKKDPDELKNVLEHNTEKTAELKDILKDDWKVNEIINDYKNKQKHLQLLPKWSENVDVMDQSEWTIPQRALKPPEVL
ncbi:MAG: sulfatase-like hydrolase/transferase [bacterium]